MKLNLSQILKGLGEVATTVNPVVGGGLLLAGVVADEFDGIPDEVLEKNFVGFKKSSEILRKVTENNCLEEVDKRQLLMIADNLDGMSKLLQKIEKIFK